MKPDIKEWAADLGVDPLVVKLIQNRGIESKEEARSFLRGTEDELHDPFLLPDMEKACEAVSACIAAGGKIRIIGDYDVDGVTSSYILECGLGSLGADVSVAIPHRVSDGYGINDRLVEDAAGDGVDLILTCDNGIAAAKQIEHAYELGMKVVVTDHHEVPYAENEDGSRTEILPVCEAVVDPKRAESAYPFPGICGAVVAYKLMMAMQRKTGSESLRDSLNGLLGFAAMGTVCDIMDLKDENHIIVKEGLKRVKNTSNVGLSALIDACEIDRDKLSAYHFGFVIGPCINASGRLDSAEKAIKLFETEDRERAAAEAGELKALNDDRKSITEKGKEEAERYIEEHNLFEKDVWIIFLPEVHESVAGIVAGKIKEKYNHPVIVLTKAEEGLKGSGRSIPGFHMFDALVACDKYLTKFGGHAMAAGLSLEEDKLENFSDAMNEYSTLTEEDFIPVCMIDADVPLSYFNIVRINEFSVLEPCGAGNPTPVFMRKGVTFTGIRRFGAEKQYTRYIVKDSDGRNFELVSFDDRTAFADTLAEKYGEGSMDLLESGKASYEMDIRFTAGINSYRGEEYLQFILKGYR